MFVYNSVIYIRGGFQNNTLLDYFYYTYFDLKNLNDLALKEKIFMFLKLGSRSLGFFYIAKNTTNSYIDHSYL